MLERNSFSIVVLFSLSGCAATAGNASYRTLRADYDQTARASQAAPSERGSLEAGTKSAGQTGEATLDRASYVRAVLDSNPTIESARLGWRAAVAKVRRTGGFEDPMVDLGLAPLSVGSSTAHVGYALGISQKLPWFGKRSLEASAAAAEAEAAKNDFEATRRELAMTAVTLYDQYFVTVRSLEINGEHLDLMRSLRGGALAQFESGRGSAQDPLQAESELARIERDHTMLSSERDVVVAQMNELLHREPSASLAPPAKELPLPSDRVGDDKALAREAEAGRPDITALKHRARAEQARADRAGREYFPDFTVSTSYNSMWDMPEHRWMVGLGFNLPIQAGGRAAEADEASANRAKFESDARRLEASARTEVYVSLKKLAESRAVLRLFEERLIPVARDQIEAARSGFTTSRNPFMAVVEAERNLRSIELDYQMARAEADRRYAELERALGRIPGLGARSDEKDHIHGR
jgi:outer membrane protein, heavy metal efflux system